MIQIIADTTCGISPTELIAKGIHVLPQIITFGDTSYRDDNEIDTAKFLEKLQSSKRLPGTAAPPPSLYTPIYEAILAAGDQALVITPSLKMSGTYRSAVIAAEEFHTNDIQVVDSKIIGGGLGSLVLQAKHWADAGMTMPELIDRVRSMADRERVFFLVDTLEYLHKGGRIGGAARIFGSVLQIKPILTVKDGQVEPYDKVRTFKQALNTIEAINLDLCQGNPQPFLTVSHCGAEEEARLLAERLTEKLELDRVPIYTVPPAIVVHAGPGLITTSCFTAA